MAIFEELENAEISVNLYEDGSIIAEFCFDRDAAMFSGHFPGTPILPGILQLEMVRRAVEKANRSDYVIKSVGKTKFSEQILPGEIVNIKITVKKKEDELEVKALLRTDDKNAGKTSMLLALR